MKKDIVRREGISIIYQHNNLLSDFTAEENVQIPLLTKGYSRSDSKKKALKTLAMVNLSSRTKHFPSELSGGEQQRVAVARALASKPKFILADEPTANLDSISTNKLLDIMYKLNQEEKITFIFSTHDQRVIDRAKRVISLEDGKIFNDQKI